MRNTRLYFVCLHKLGNDAFIHHLCFHRLFMWIIKKTKKQCLNNIKEVGAHNSKGYISINNVNLHIHRTQACIFITIMCLQDLFRFQCKKHDTFFLLIKWLKYLVYHCVHLDDLSNFHLNSKHSHQHSQWIKGISHLCPIYNFFYKYEKFIICKSHTRNAWRNEITMLRQQLDQKEQPLTTFQRERKTKFAQSIQSITQITKKKIQ